MIVITQVLGVVALIATAAALSLVAVWILTRDARAKNREFHNRSL